ncbi:hypothetical protein FRC10_010002 [Ceratobasidium sp. 414]|nr:hypothetical protein FRC10_010002 [Ceratobasidium sp. 414]
MLFLYPATLVLALSKFLLLCVLTTHNVSTYVGITAVDAGLRATHFATYATLSRSGLQLPVSAFIPAPEALSTTDIVLYAVPAAVAAWRSSIGALSCVSDFVTSLEAVVSRAVDATHRQWVHYTNMLVHIRSVALLSRKRTHYLDEIQWPCYNRSSVILPIIRVLYNYPPILVLSVPSTSGSEICSLPTLGVCTVGGHVPDFVATRTATPALSGLEHYRPSVEPLGALPLPQSPIVYESLADLEGVSVGFPAPDPPIIIIHVRSCLLGLLAACCFVSCCYICVRLTFRLVVRLVRFVHGWVCALRTLARGLAMRLGGIILGSIETTKLILADICGTSYTVGAEIAAPDAPLAKVEGPPPVKPTRKRNNKKKKKAGKGSKVQPSSTALTLSSIPTPSTIASGDEGGEWTTVTRTRKAGRAPGPVLGGGPKSATTGGQGHL